MTEYREFELRSRCSEGGELTELDIALGKEDTSVTMSKSWRTPRLVRLGNSESIASLPEEYKAAAHTLAAIKKPAT